ncbi:bifunctional folylpolyglutamate synthase/dihydrofolate synthase [Pedobacter duraquae]|uniref:Dihydrofolate synthase/folylpolyglutamate synthase n=1 Tax=Pedobacter duraquae TaxID=425511 RepID=A0A4V3C485_9SPHI|nr:folylpolyglutamate synthase/dihydrofolate synthase family protein [Pedobacter duraquae]TDO24978.1 dihydrofolate synthase/folylpolyglutamate synthase [Pedobacter duraquae]
MNYQETLDYLYSKLPMFTRIGEAALKKDLHNTIALCAQLGNPQDHFKTIHIGGTNGKGSTSHMLSAILQEAGYKTGLYTSPHLKDFRERIKINGAMVPESFVTDFVETQNQFITELQPSFFEVTVGLAFSYFAAEKVDVAIIEVGLGGRLDSTNIIHPDLSVITNISLDHTNILGNTIAEIAYEKAGIIKSGIPAVIGERVENSADVFINKAAEVGAELHFASEDIRLIDSNKTGEMLQLTLTDRDHNELYKNLELDLTGMYQLKNVRTVVAAVIELRKIGYRISDKHVYAALKEVKTLTGLQGRWQQLGTNPTVICDTGHNVAGIQEILQNINQTPHQHLHMVIGFVKDKDISSILAMLPKDAIYYFTEPQLERALPAAELAERSAEFGLQGQTIINVLDALETAKTGAAQSDLIFVGGSTFVVAEVL